MIDSATMDDIRSDETESAPTKMYLDVTSGGLNQFGDNPLAKIDLARAEAINTATVKEKGAKYKREYTLKKLFLLYVKKYATKWNAMANYPKQIRQKPAWFDLALSMFKENEISSSDKKKLNEVFNTLWEYRDKILPERVMSEEESTRQYGVRSPYFVQPESQTDIQQPQYSQGNNNDMSSEDVLSQPVQEDYAPVYTGDQQVIQQPDTETTLGVRKFTPPREESFLSGYISPIRSSMINTTPSVKPIVKTPQPPQRGFNIGITQVQKENGGSGNGAFSIGRNMLSGMSGGDSLQGIIKQRLPTPPSQPIQVRPSETITVAEPPQAMQRKQKKSKSLVNRKVIGSSGLSRFRSIELPSIPKSKMSPSISMKINKSPTPMKINKGSNLKLSKKSGNTFKVDKGMIGNMTRDIKSSVGGVVGGIKVLKQQVRGEMKGNNSINTINIKNLRSNKVKDHKDLNVLKQLKSDTHNQISREALECKMIPKLKAQCDDVFRNNHITNEVSKFRNEFKDIHKMVPVVKGEKASLSEVSMLGRSIDHGVDGVHVDDIRSMYKSSGTTKQMNIGKMEYDYSFATGKKKHKIPTEYYEGE